MRPWYADSGVKGCERCGEADISPNIEAYELSGECVCDECAEHIFEEYDDTENAARAHRA